MLLSRVPKVRGVDISGALLDEVGRLLSLIRTPLLLLCFLCCLVFAEGFACRGSLLPSNVGTERVHFSMLS